MVCRKKNNFLLVNKNAIQVKNNFEVTPRTPTMILGICVKVRIEWKTVLNCFRDCDFQIDKISKVDLLLIKMPIFKQTIKIFFLKFKFF